MPTIDELRAELDDVLTLQFIASAFTEVAASRIGKIKTQFENNRQFFDEISYLYHLVQASSRKMKGESKTGGVRGKHLMVAVTSNQRFYGNLNINIMQSYMADADVTPGAELMVIGVTGADFMDSPAGGGRKFLRRQFAKDNPTEEETSKFLDDIKEYETVMMYYPKFVTLMSQTVGKTDVTQAADLGEKIPETEINILFEPDLSHTLEFFKRHLRAILFLRVMLESDLSRTAARLLTMSGAEERSRDLLKQKKSQLRKIQLSITNAKLLETFAAMSGWKKT
jgi:ATP synthase F1 gamma subunit